MLTAQQLEWRRKGIGSSDAGVIAGHSIFRDATPFAIWSSKVFGDHSETTPVMEFGNIFEAGIARWYSKQFEGVRCRKACGRVHRRRRWQRATPDYYVHQGKRVVRLLECKWVGPGAERHWDLEDPFGVPAMVRDQVDWQMDVTGIHEADVGALFPAKRTGRVWRFTYDEQRAAALREQCERFWRDHVLAEVPPPLDASSAATRYLDRSFSEGADTIPATVEAEDIAARLDWWTKAAKLADEQHELAANQLKELIGDAAGIKGRWGKATWLKQRGAVKWKAVAEHFMQLLLNHGTYPDYLQAAIEMNRTPERRVLRLRMEPGYEPQTEIVRTDNGRDSTGTQLERGG